MKSQPVRSRDGGIGDEPATHPAGGRRALDLYCAPALDRACHALGAAGCKKGEEKKTDTVTKPAEGEKPAETKPAETKPVAKPADKPAAKPADGEDKSIKTPAWMKAAEKPEGGEAQ